ncbi:MAG TPA: IscS subfamily cysteine desulfurase [Deltaproteobacteria bacterium]|nr:IscS subfamily cysteine desulfurase [Deltaproteobacteria bacterium]
MKTPIYLDYHATSPVDPRVLEVMLPFLREDFGNAASRQHVFGWKAEAAVTRAREQIAAALGAEAKEIIFTSGATEANNLALFGIVAAYRERGRHLITAATEHRAVLDPCRHLESQGFAITVLPVDTEGRISLEALQAALRPDTILISLMAANNEIGTLHDLAAIGRLAKEKNILFHSDAAQAAGKIPLNVTELGIDLLSLSAHKFYGPKGIGALYVRQRNPRVQLQPIIFGGGHERALRSGTLNVPGIVGMGEALALAVREMPQESLRLSGLRERLRDRIFSRLENVRVNGPRSGRLSNNLNLCFTGVNSDALMMEMKEVAVASGSACSSASPEPSHVLRAIGLNVEEAKASIRFGLGRWTTEEEVDYTADRIVEVVPRLRD